VSQIHILLFLKQDQEYPHILLMEIDKHWFPTKKGDELSVVIGVGSDTFGTFKKYFW
jgi:hypothetical protein